MSRLLLGSRRYATRQNTCRAFTSSSQGPSTFHCYSSFIGTTTNSKESGRRNSVIKGTSMMGLDEQAAILRGSRTTQHTNIPHAFADQQHRGIRTSAPTENPVIIGGLAVAAGAIALRYAVESYQAWAAKRKSSVADVSKYYKGDFEEEMTRREASLILGVRESADKTRIRERYKKMLILNHPDRGGSTYIAGKINEANELLTRGK